MSTTVDSDAPTSWLLDGRVGWRTARRDGVSVGASSGIRLAVDAGGPLAANSADYSMGGLRLPRGMALDERGRVHLLVRGEVLRFEPASARFTPLRLPDGGRAGGNAAEHLAIAGAGLYLANATRLRIFDLRTLALVEAHGPRDWEPAELDARGDRAWLLDRRHGRVYQHRWGQGGLELVVDSPADAGTWSQLTVDRNDRVYVLVAPTGTLRVFAPDGRAEPTPEDPGDVRDRFDLPQIRLDHHGRFCVPADLAVACGARAPGAIPPPHAPLALCAPGSGGHVFDRVGQPTMFDPAEAAGPALYARQGRWISEALDSRIHRCQWDRIEIELADLPPGARVVASTYADETDRSIAELTDDLWSRPAAVTSPAGDVLVQSRGGRYLRLRLELQGDGHMTPSVRSVRVRYPRDSYLRFLPAVYSADDESRWLLERFLAAFQTEWDGIEDTIARVERYFDPAAVPDGAALRYLAGWLALPLEGGWDDTQRRHLLEAAPRLYRRRGTPAGVRDYLRTYLESMTGSHLSDDGFPQVVEGFRERELSLLGSGAPSGPGRSAPLWSASVVSRLQVGVYAREGEARMVATGDPQLDPFAEYAHRFRVFVPAVWVRTAEDERMVRRAVDAEKPAHTAYDLCLVAPRFRIGVQSRIGLDTIIAATPQARLAHRPDGACAPTSKRCDADDEPAPSLPPSRRLGFDTVLHCRPGSAPRFGTGPRVGVDATLT
jgi:phage tail-like protein